MKQKLTKENKYMLAMMMLSTLVFAFYIHLATQNHFSYLEPMLNGTAARPYVYRVLVPFTIQIISGLLDVLPFFIAIIIMYMSLLGFSWSIMELAKIYLPLQHSLPLTLLAPIGLVPFLIEQRHIYDFTTLFLFTLALYFLSKDDFNKYIATFFLATLSKETSLFLVVFFIMQFQWKSNERLKKLLIIQIVIYILIRVILIVTFKDNPGSLMEFHLYDHLNMYREQPLSAILLFITIIFITVIGVVRTNNKTNFIRNSLIAIGGPILILYFPFGVPFETRIFLEAYPSIFLIFALFISSWLIHRSNVRQLDTST